MMVEQDKSQLISSEILYFNTSSLSAAYLFINHVFTIANTIYCHFCFKTSSSLSLCGVKKKKDVNFQQRHKPVEFYLSGWNLFSESVGMTEASCSNANNKRLS